MSQDTLIFISSAVKISDQSSFDLLILLNTRPSEISCRFRQKWCLHFQDRCVLIFSWFSLEVCQNLTVRLKGVSARMTEREVRISSGITTPVFAYKYCNKSRQSGFEVRTLRIQYQNSSAKYTCAVAINLLKPTAFLGITRFDIQKFYMVITLHLCVVCGSQNKQ